MTKWEYGLYYVGQWSLLGELKEPVHHSLKASREILAHGMFSLAVIGDAVDMVEVWEGVDREASMWREHARRNELGSNGWRMGAPLRTEGALDRDYKRLPVDQYPWLLEALKAVREVEVVDTYTVYQLERCIAAGRGVE